MALGSKYIYKGLAEINKYAVVSERWRENTRPEHKNEYNQWKPTLP